MPNESTIQGDPPVKIQRVDDFLAVYANNVVVDATAWDLRLTFGQFEKLPDDSMVNNQRLSVNMPFGLAKLMLFWIELQIISHEIQTGKRVGMRSGLIPDPPTLIGPENENDPNFVKLHAAITQLRNRLIASLE